MRILIGYDGSDCADAALDDLVRAGLPASSEALVLAVADLLPLPEGPDGEKGAPRPVRAWRAARECVVRDAVAWAERGRTRLAGLLPTWWVEADAAADSPAWALTARAGSWKADLLVVGSHGRSALVRAWLGSVAQHAVHHAPCSVRVARGRPARERAGGVRLVVGVDGSKGADAAVATILARTWPSGSAARVVTAMNPVAMGGFERSCAGREDPEAWARTVAEVVVEKLAASGLDATSVLRDGDAKRMLLAEARDWGADAVFVGEHGWRGPQGVFLGSVAVAVAAGAPCSVEVVRAR